MIQGSQSKNKLPYLKNKVTNSKKEWGCDSSVNVCLGIMRSWVQGSIPSTTKNKRKVIVRIKWDKTFKTSTLVLTHDMWTENGSSCPTLLTEHEFLIFLISLRNHTNFKGSIADASFYSSQILTQFLTCDRLLAYTYWLTQTLGKHFLIDQHSSRKYKSFKMLSRFIMRRLW